MNNHIIREWEASYYCWHDQTWKYGKLAICLNSISFLENNSIDDEAKISLELSRVTGFQRRAASLLFKAVVVCLEGGKPQWFSSLQNREETYFFLEHFWKQRLLGLGSSRKKIDQRNKHDATGLIVDDKEKRRKLFEVLYDSETTLTKAAESFYNQGEQFDHASRTMNTMHKDLNVAETLINGLDSWLTKWDVSPEYFHEIDMKKEFPILYRVHSRASFYPGTLVMTQDHFTVLDAKRVAVVTMLFKDMTIIVVRTPWNIALVKSTIGEPDLSVEISSTHVVYILKALQLGYGDKFEYEVEPSPYTHQVINPTVEISSEIQHQQQRISGLDEADLENVSGVVSNMRSLAIGIGQEMNRQHDRLDQLSESVDKANYRIEKDNRKLRDKL